MKNNNKNKNLNKGGNIKEGEEDLTGGNGQEVAQNPFARRAGLSRSPVTTASQNPPISGIDSIRDYVIETSRDTHKSTPTIYTICTTAATTNTVTSSAASAGSSTFTTFSTTQASMVSVKEGGNPENTDLACSLELSRTQSNQQKSAQADSSNQKASDTSKGAVSKIVQTGIDRYSHITKRKRSPSAKKVSPA